jgi:RNA polymerase sigma factor (sigma-70 family)
VPENPRAWLITVASRRLADELRSDRARRRREETAAVLVPPDELLVSAAGDEHPPEEDDTLTLLFLCAHPALTPASQVALTLRAVGGLTTAEVARAFLVPETTIAQRISRAKQNIKASGIPFRLPPEPERADRLRVVLHVLYLIFNEGYTATSGPDLHRSELTAEAIRLTREARRRLPEDGEVAGLLALMLLTDARRPARTRPDRSVVPLAEQDRRRWNEDYMREGVDLITDSLSRTTLGPYQLQAAIAAVRAHLLEMADDHVAARASYGIAARRTTSFPERRYLETRAARLTDDAGDCTSAVRPSDLHLESGDPAQVDARDTADRHEHDE